MSCYTGMRVKTLNILTFRLLYKLWLTFTISRFSLTPKTDTYPVQLHLGRCPSAEDFVLYKIPIRLSQVKKIKYLY